MIERQNMAGFSSRYIIFSTSPRSPKRVPFYLSLLSKFEGEKWNRNIQSKYYQEMVNNQKGNFPIGKSNDPALSARDKITRAPKALGLVKLKPEIQITQPGKLIQNKYLFSDILTKQLLKYQLPSPLLPERAENKGYFNIKPFLEMLRLIDHFKDLSRSEFYAFGVTMTNYHNFNDTVDKINIYRKEAETNHIHAKKHFHDYMINYITELYNDVDNFKIRETNEKSKNKFIKTKINNAIDYGNACLRYLTGTGLVLVNKNLKVVIAPRRQAEVNYILKTIPRDAKNIDKKQYLSDLYNENIPHLLSDNNDQLIKRINQLNKDLQTFNIKTPNTLYKSLTSLELKKELYEKENKVELLSRQKYAKSLKDYTSEQVQDVLDTFTGIKKNEYFDNPLYLEWNTWRAITMIDNGNIKGFFKTNINGDPTSTAAGNTADIIGDYGDFNMVCEVTLSTGHKQFEMESEPVTRHLGQLRIKENGKETFGLFIANKIQDSVIAYFYSLYKINLSIYGGTVEFIPLTIDDFCTFFKNATSKTNKLSQKDIQKLHATTIKFAQSAQNEKEWYSNIKKYILSI